MPNHQERRRPLPADYQHPTHGVDCDCPTCRNRWADVPVIEGATFEADGVMYVVGPPLEPTAETPWAV